MDSILYDTGECVRWEVDLPLARDTIDSITSGRFQIAATVSMRTIFVPGKRCWTYFCVIVLFNAVSLYFGWTLFENLTHTGNRRRLSSRLRQDVSQDTRSYLPNIRATFSPNQAITSFHRDVSLLSSNDDLGDNQKMELFLRIQRPPEAGREHLNVTVDRETKTPRKAKRRRKTIRTTFKNQQLSAGAATTIRTTTAKVLQQKIHENNLLSWKQTIFLNRQGNSAFSVGSSSDIKIMNKNPKKEDGKKSYASSRALEFFNTRMDAKELRAFTDILYRFVELVTAHNLTYFLYSGTLLGSYRHHGIIPWDDDMDVIMNISDKPIIRRVLSSRLPNYLLNDKQGKRWKFFSTLSRPIPGISWSWPYLDISFFRENQTHIWDSDPAFRASYTFPKEDVFPLYNRPFMDSMLPAPRDTGRFLGGRYSMSECKSNTYDHRMERFVSMFMRKSIPCEALRDIYPMVSHNPMPGGTTNETLIFKGNIVRWFIRQPT